MNKEYDFRAIESKWQDKWAKSKYGQSEDSSDKPKHYHLVEFPYPSGAGLHVGHCMGYGASDAYCRMKRMQGFNVMYPMGWDAFGLPTENYAIKNKIKPQKATADNIATFKNQMRALAYSFDWPREINTTDPDYYRWTQWIFLQFYKHAVIGNKLIEVKDDDTETPRLAFQAEMPVNWCPSCKIVLANEEVVAGACERCGAQTEKRKQKQWMLRITAYADRLIDDLETVDYLDKIKTQQVNWIGKSEGAEIDFKIVISTEAEKSHQEDLSTNARDDKKKIKVFTTRADTLFGCTYVVLSPEHPLIENLKSKIKNWNEVQKYIDSAKKKSDLERTDLEKDKTGVELKGIRAVNPINNEEVPVWIADYCLANYGTGAVMAVPAHDQRDFEFATKYGIEIRRVVEPKYITSKEGCAPKPGEKFIKRNAICAVVRNPKDDTYLCISWKTAHMHGLVTGGVEDGEDIVEAAKREVLEETGYKNLKLVRDPKIAIHSLFYHRVKKENRWARFQYLIFDLENEDRAPIKQEEADLHDVIWKSRDELEDFFSVTEGHYIEKIISGEVDTAFTEEGVLFNSGEFDWMDSKEANERITEKLKANGAGHFSINFKLRDWIFSRQHYWGEPIPIIHCDKCGTIPVPEDHLPVKLPEVENYEPTDSGESPLAKMTEWVNVKCPNCGGDAKRETDTMPNWAGSSWYFLAYAMTERDYRSSGFTDSQSIFKSKNKELNYWLPIDIYNGGMEHTTLHLLYSRFWHKFLFDSKAVPTPEPYAKRIAHGIILGPDGRKMSKSFGNVINPDDIVDKFGADTLRAYIMFIGPYDQESAWNTAGVQGVYRFLKRVWNNQDKIKECADSKELLVKLNQTVAGVSDDLENFRMNTVVSKLMELNNTIEKTGSVSKESYSIFLRLLFPICPHIASELWEMTGFDGYISDQKWPETDEKYLIADEIEIVVQINGKVKDKLKVPAGISDADLKESALNSDKTKAILAGKTIKKTIIVPGKLISIVTDEQA